MPKGQIIRALSGFYYVSHNDNIYECRARGIFKQRNQSPLVGDFVDFDITDKFKGYITEIMPRKNELRRPPISNIDQVILVSSVIDPEFSTLLLDKFLIHVENIGIEPIICITKIDLINDLTDINKKIEIYKNIGYKVMKTSIYRENNEEIREVLKDKISVLSGQSGVGKSSLLNALIPDLELVTGVISKRLGQGKHTTREVQLIKLPSGGMVADTPGFSQLDYSGIKSYNLSMLFPEINRYTGHCRFRGCLHYNEPNCSVKEALEEGLIDKERYDHYLIFLKEILDIEENRWR